MSTCPCGGVPAGAPYESCCAPALHNQHWPETAEALMRSRYTAFALHDADHLFRTWHPRARPARMHLDRQTHWTRLRVLRSEDGGPQDTAGTVEFRAEYRDRAGAGAMHEVARFEKRAGRWFYTAATEEQP